MTLVVQDALQEVLDKVFTGKDRGALLEALLHQVLANTHDGLTLTLDEARQLDTSKTVAVKVGPDLTVTVTPSEGAPPASRRKVEAA